LMSRIVSPSRKDDKFDYQYVKRIVDGRQNDIYFNESKRNGWEAVMAKDYPELGVGVDDSNGYVVLGGMILVRRAKPEPPPKPVVEAKKPEAKKPKSKYFAKNESGKPIATVKQTPKVPLFGRKKKSKTG
jgi:hypothetical protein